MNYFEKLSYIVGYLQYFARLFHLKHVFNKISVIKNLTKLQRIAEQWAQVPRAPAFYPVEF